MRIRKYRNHIIVALAVIAITGFGFYHFAFYLVFGFDHLRDPDHEKIYFVEGNKISLEMTITKYCRYEIGVGFRSKDGEYKPIEEVFGYKRSNLIFPALLDIKVKGNEQEIVFERINFGGKKFGSRAGSNPIRFIASISHLSPGKYWVSLDIKKLEKDFSKLDAYYFADINPKITCGKT